MLILQLTQRGSKLNSLIATVTKILPLWLALPLLLATPIQALESDQHQMIKIQADSAYLDDKKGLTIYEGNVDLQQGSLKIHADKITLTSHKNGDIDTLTAKGRPAKFQQKPSKDENIVYGRASVVKYEISKEKITLKGNAHIKQGQAELNSDNIVYLANQQIFKAQRDTTSKNQKPKRVQMIIHPKKKTSEDQ